MLRNFTFIFFALLMSNPAVAGCAKDHYKDGLFGVCLPKAGGDVAKGTEAVKQGVQHLGREINKEAIKLGESIDENKKTIAAVAIVATVGWAACADGCTFVGSLIAGGAAIPVVVTDANSPDDRDSNSGGGSRNTGEGADNSDPSSSYKPNVVEEYPPGFSKVNYPKGVAPKMVYRSPRDDLGSIFNEFAFPTAQAVIRYPTISDPAGGVMESPRSGLPNGYSEKFGPEARRVHAGIDFLTFPGESVFAPMSGKIETVKPMTNKNGLQMVTIRAQDGTLARTLYVQPNETIRVGSAVKAGVTVIGTAQNIAAAYNLDSTPNHIHVDYTDYKNRRFDPWTNKVVDRRGP